MVDRVERIVREQVRPEELEGILSLVGYQIVNYQYVRGTQRAELNLDLVSAADRERSDTELMNRLAGNPQALFGFLVVLFDIIIVSLKVEVRLLDPGCVFKSFSILLIFPF